MNTEFNLTLNCAGVRFRHRRYNCAELQELRRRMGSRFRTQVKVEPSDLSYVWIFDPQKEHWLRVPVLATECPQVARSKV